MAFDSSTAYVYFAGFFDGEGVDKALRNDAGIETAAVTLKLLKRATG